MFKRLFCMHKNTEERWRYIGDFTYNEKFDVAQITRRRIVVCKDCGKVLETLFVSWICHEQIYDEVKKKYEDAFKGGK